MTAVRPRIPDEDVTHRPRAHRQTAGLERARSTLHRRKWQLLLVAEDRAFRQLRLGEVTVAS
jgi:hypothetical protein